MTMKKWCDDLFTWAIFNLVVALCWAGAEYYYEGAVVPSDVDTVIGMLLAWYMTQDYNRRIKKEG